MKQLITITLTCCAFLLTSAAFAEDENGPKITRQQYIDMWKDEAIKQMQQYGVPASIKLAQGILESADGNSMLARKANNHFGIKCHGWSGPGVYKDDDAKNECFRKYKNAKESFEDHSLFLLKPRYADLFTYKTTDYKAWAHGLKKAGYATNPKYPQLLIRIIEENELYKYDSPQKGKQVASKPTKPGTPVKGGGNTIDYTIGYTEMITDNRVKFVFAKSGDTYQSVADAMNLHKWQLLKYNDAKSNKTLAEGERVYIKPKRNKAAGTDYHIATEGQTLREISQLHAVKLKRLVKYNELQEDTPLGAGKKVKLKR
jgi:LysM repeat protein